MEKIIIGNDWDELLSPILNSNKIQKLWALINMANSPQYPRRVYPEKKDVFNAFKHTSYADTKVVILGQDPYINPGQAHGFAFSVPVGVAIPPSLVNIFKELHDDMGCYIPNNGCLIPWADQGVLLLNTILTVDEGRSRSHAGMGWEELTDYVIKLLNDKDQSIVFMLWGNYARKKAELIDPAKHLILQAPHPSPLAGGAFFGCRHFSQASNFLYEIYPNTIDWQIPNV